MFIHNNNGTLQQINEENAYIRSVFRMIKQSTTILNTQHINSDWELINNIVGLKCIPNHFTPLCISFRSTEIQSDLFKTKQGKKTAQNQIFTLTNEQMSLYLYNYFIAI